MNDRDDIPPPPRLSDPTGEVVGADMVEVIDDDDLDDIDLFNEDAVADFEPDVMVGQEAPRAPAVAVATVPSLTITCPGCGSVSLFLEIRRDASEFCRGCDYPLFWARGAELGAAGSPSGVTESGLRRLPGTSGRVAIATIVCWSCDEPNQITSKYCVRCGEDLRPKAPEPVPEPVFIPPPPPPPPPPPGRAIWPWVILALFVVATIVAFLVAS